MTDRELMQKALEMIGQLKPDNWHDRERQGQVWDALRERLAQPEQEPIAWIERDMQCDDFDPDSVTCQKPDIAAAGWEWVALYTSPPRREWVGLTEEEIMSLVPVDGKRPATTFARAIEDKLKEKNT
jgi:hypothetical protein